MQIHASSEDYLEMILMLAEQKEEVHSIDIASGLNVSKPSVSCAMKRLRENGYIEMDDNKRITLTESGFEIASRIYQRHQTLTQLLLYIGVDPAVAREDACKLEHDISPAAFRAIHDFVASKN